MMETSFGDIRVFNIVILGISFLLIFSAFQTCEMIQEVVLESMNDEAFKGSGFKSLAIIYGSFALFNWFAPSIVMCLGIKWSLILGGLTYCIYIGTFIAPNIWAIYGSSCLLGLGAAILWTAQGTFITHLSNSSTIERNTGIFWSLFQSSLVVGNAIMFFKFQDQKVINRASYEALYTILLALSCVGWVFIVALIKAPATKLLVAETSERTPLLDSENAGYSGSHQTRNLAVTINQESETSISPLTMFYKFGDMMSPRQVYSYLVPSLRLFKDKRMVMLTCSFAFTGLNLTFVSGILTTCIGYNLRWGERSKALMGICGMLVGVGEILGGINVSIIKRVSDWCRASSSTPQSFTQAKSDQGARTSAVATSGYIFNLVCYYILYLVLPSDSPINATYGPAFITKEPLSTLMVCVSSLMLGLADSALNTQLYVVMGTHYAKQSAPVFALFKFVQCVAAACSFYYSKYLQLHWQLLILVTSATLSIYTFMLAEYDLSCGDGDKVTGVASFGDDAGDRTSPGSSISSLSSVSDRAQDRAGPHWVDIRY